MPRYWFRVPYEEQPLPVDLQDDEQAWGQAVTYVGELLCDIDGKLASPARLKLQVDDGSSDVLAEIEVTALRRSK